MSDLAEIKLLLLEDDNLEKLMEEMGFEYISYEQGHTLLTAQLPPEFDSRNKRACQIRLNESLNVNIRNRSDFQGDIYSLVSYVVYDARDEEINQNLYKAKSFICTSLGIDAKNLNVSKRNDFAKGLKSLAKKTKKNKYRPNVPIPENTLEKYLDLYPDVWIKEGISKTIMDYFGIRIDLYTGRIIIPVRNKRGQLVGTKGRGQYLPFEDDRKYLFLENCDQSKELFGYYRAKRSIKNKRQVLLFEGEKSVMKCFDNKTYNAVSVGSSSLSSEQIKLINECGEDIQVIIAFDKGSEPDIIKKMAEQLPNNEVYAIMDTKDLLKNSDSPVDQGWDVFQQLVDECCYEIS